MSGSRTVTGRSVRKFVKPRIVVSQCLGFEACRYNGQVLPDSFLSSLQPYVEFVQVCPEVSVGLGVPRDPVRLVSRPGSGAHLRLIQPATDRDLTRPMKCFSTHFLKGLRAVDGFILKSASPSCAVKDAKRYPVSEGSVFAKGPGIFGQAVLERFPEAAVEDEDRLKNLRLREHFLTRVFTLAEFRNFRKSPSIGKLVELHSQHKFLLMAYHQRELRIMGRIVANRQQASSWEVAERYQRHLVRALIRPPRYTSNINVLLHVLGYVSDQLSPQEKAYFLDILAEYRKQQVPLSMALAVMKSWLIRSETRRLLDQVYFEPFPVQLVSLHDSGKRNREL